MSILKPLVFSKSLTAQSPSYEYRIRKDSESKDKYMVTFLEFNANHDEPAKEPARGFATIDEAEKFVQGTHYPHTMQPYTNDDTITDIKAWFKAAKPEPTNKDICTQIGCHYEEVSEMDMAIMGADGKQGDNDLLAKWYKGLSPEMADYEISGINKLELLDSLCDQIVTATGVAYMMGFGIEGAIKEVIRSNNSKMVKGKFIFDDNGKIQKPESYSEPDLKPFLNKGE